MILLAVELVMFVCVWVVPIVVGRRLYRNGVASPWKLWVGISLFALGLMIACVSTINKRRYGSEAEAWGGLTAIVLPVAAGSALCLAGAKGKK